MELEYLACSDADSRTGVGLVSVERDVLIPPNSSLRASTFDCRIPPPLGGRVGASAAKGRPFCPAKRQGEYEHKVMITGIERFILMVAPPRQCDLAKCEGRPWRAGGVPGPLGVRSWPVGRRSGRFPPAPILRPGHHKFAFIFVCPSEEHMRQTTLVSAIVRATVQGPPAQFLDLVWLGKCEPRARAQ